MKILSGFSTVNQRHVKKNKMHVQSGCIYEHTYPETSRLFNKYSLRRAYDVYC